MRESAFSKLGSQPWRRVLAAVSRSQASTCCCAAGCTDDVLEIRRASVSVYSKQFEHDTRPRDQDKTKFEHNSVLHRGLATRKLFICPSDHPSIYLSVCLSNAWIVTKQKKVFPRFLYHTKDHSSSFYEKTNGWWG